MWTSLENTYEYFRAEVAQDPEATEATLKAWLEKLQHVTQALAALNERCVMDPPDGVYTRVIKALGRDFNRLSIRSRALLLQFHCAYPDVQSAGWAEPCVPVSAMEGSVSRHINNAMTALENQYTLAWERTGSPAAVRRDNRSWANSRRWVVHSRRYPWRQAVNLLSIARIYVCVRLI